METKTFRPFIFFQHRSLQLNLERFSKSLIDQTSIELPIVNPPKYETLNETMKDFDVIKKYGEELIVQPLDTVLAEMHAVMTIGYNTNDMTYENPICWYIRERVPSGFYAHIMKVFCYGVFGCGWFCETRVLYDADWMSSLLCLRNSKIAIPVLHKAGNVKSPHFSLRDEQQFNFPLEFLRGFFVLYFFYHNNILSISACFFMYVEYSWIWF